MQPIQFPGDWIAFSTVNVCVEKCNDPVDRSILHSIIFSVSAIVAAFLLVSISFFMVKLHGGLLLNSSMHPVKHINMSKHQDEQKNLQQKFKKNIV